MAEENAIPTRVLSDFVGDERIQALVLKELQKAGRKAGLANFEIIDGIVLTAFEWTIQNVSSLPATEKLCCI